MVERSPDLFYWGSASYFPRKNEPLNCRAFWEPLSCRECVLRTAGKIYEGIRVVCTFLKNWKKLEPINCGGYWNQLLAAIGTNYLPQVHKNPAISRPNLPRRIVFWNFLLPKVQIGS